jgi:uncharacterized protein DUF2786
MTTTAEQASTKLIQVRKLLAKAEAEGTTPQEAEALTAKAAELMARYGIDRARLGALHPETDRPGSRKIDIPNPWGQVRAHLLAGIAGAMGCQCVLLPTTTLGARLHLFGYESDLERADVMYTSLLLQMASALRQAPVPAVRSVRAWNRSFLLGYITAVVARVRAAEDAARGTARAEDAASGGPSTELVLADRAMLLRSQRDREYPVLRKTRITYTGRGYSDGYSKGQQADIGGTSVRGGRPALAR